LELCIKLWLRLFVFLGGMKNGIKSKRRAELFKEDWHIFNQIKDKK